MKKSSNLTQSAVVAQGGWNGVDDVDEDEFCLILFVPFSGFCVFFFVRGRSCGIKVVGSM